MTQFVYAVGGIVVGALVNILINLVAAAIYQRVFSEQISNQSLWLLAMCLGVFLLVGLWLGQRVTVPDRDEASASSAGSDPVSTPGNLETVEMTRLTALLSYGKLRGQGIRLQDILLIGSRIDIDTKP